MENYVKISTVSSVKKSRKIFLNEELSKNGPTIIINEETKSSDHIINQEKLASGGRKRIKMLNQSSSGRQKNAVDNKMKNESRMKSLTK